MSSARIGGEVETGEEKEGLGGRRVGEPGGVTYCDFDREEGGEPTGDGGGPPKEHFLQKKRRLLDCASAYVRNPAHEQ